MMIASDQAMICFSEATIYPVSAIKVSNSHSIGHFYSEKMAIFQPQENDWDLIRVSLK